MKQLLRVGFYRELAHGTPHGESLHDVVHQKSGPDEALLVRYLRAGAILIASPAMVRPSVGVRRVGWWGIRLSPRFARPRFPGILSVCRKRTARGLRMNFPSSRMKVQHPGVPLFLMADSTSAFLGDLAGLSKHRLYGWATSRTKLWTSSARALGKASW